MTLRFLRTAHAELQQAVAYYDSQDPNLGSSFLIEIASALERISEFPEAWQLVEVEIRRCQLGRFPYALIYAVEEDAVLVLSVAHLHKRPEKWSDRLTRKT